jgi:predicted ester cyclase
MTSEENKAKVRGIFGQIDKEKSMAAFVANTAPNYIVHFPGLPPGDAAAMRAIGDGFFAAFPDLTHTLDEAIAEGDLVALRLTLRGTHKAPLVLPAGEVPATGKSIEFPAMNMMRMAEGKVVEHWVQFDSMTVMQQLGVAG